MDKTKFKRYLTTVPPGVWWLSDKLTAHHKKKQAKQDADAIFNIERLYRLKERGAISEEEFHELKEKLKKQFDR